MGVIFKRACMFKYFFYKIGQTLTGFLPLKAAYGIAVFFSDIQYLVSPRDRRAVCDNLHVILGNHCDVRRLSRAVFRNFGKYLVEFFRMQMVTPDFIQQHVVIENQYRLDQALQKGRGVIILTAHIGNWEMGGVVLGQMGYPLTAVALPHRERPVNELFNRQRAAGGVTVVPAQLAIRRCLSALKKNGIVALLADRDFSATGQPMPFFGRETMIPQGAAMFAYRTRAEVLPMFLTRAADMTFKINIQPPLNLPDHCWSMEEKAFRLFFMKQQVAVLEQNIQEDPSQWMMFRRFWIDHATGPERIVST